MKQRGEVAGKLPAVLCPRKRKQHPAAPRGAKMQKHSAKGWHCARAEAKRGAGRKDGEQCHWRRFIQSIL